MPRIIFTPSILPKEVVDQAKAMAPSNFELVVADFPSPAFSEAVKDAEYFVGFVRGGFDDANLLKRTGPAAGGPFAFVGAGAPGEGANASPRARLGARRYCSRLSSPSA